MSTPPGGGSSPSGNAGAEGWARYIELQKDFPFANGDELLASPKVLLYNQRNLQVRPRMTESQVQAYLDYRKNYKQIIAGWMDQYDVDSVVYAGFISDVYNNDSAATQLSSDRGTGVLTSNVGLPTVIVPVGTNPNGYSISMQLVGKAWDDAKILGMGYALEQQTMASRHTSFAPALTQKDNNVPSDPGNEHSDSGNGPIDSGNGPTVPGSGPTNPGNGPSTPDNGTIDKPSPEVISFTDTKGHWAEDSIVLLIKKGLLSGYPDDSFRPDLSITRAEAVKVLSTQLGLKPQTSDFTDVPASHWAAGYIGAAEESDLMNGYDDGTFRPDDQLNRAEMAALVARAFKLSGSSAVSFSDVPLDSWSYPYINALIVNKIVTGYDDGTFRPTQAITRAEFATMIARVLQR